jgi:hypothetical protein
MKTATKPRIIVVDDQVEKKPEAKKNNNALLLGGALIGLMGLAAVTSTPKPVEEKTYHSSMGSPDKTKFVGVRLTGPGVLEVDIKYDGVETNLELLVYIDNKGVLHITDNSNDKTYTTSGWFGLFDRIEQIFIEREIGPFNDENPSSSEELDECTNYIEWLTDYIRLQIWLPLFEAQTGTSLNQIKHRLGSVNWIVGYKDNPTEMKTVLTVTGDSFEAPLVPREFTIQRNTDGSFGVHTPVNNGLSAIVEPSIAPPPREVLVEEFIGAHMYTQLEEQYGGWLRVFGHELDEVLDGLMNRLSWQLEKLLTTANLTNYKHELVVGDQNYFFNIKIEETKDLGKELPVVGYTYYRVTIDGPSGTIVLLTTCSQYNYFLRTVEEPVYTTIATSSRDVGKSYRNILEEKFRTKWSPEVAKALADKFSTEIYTSLTACKADTFWASLAMKSGAYTTYTVN